MIIGFTNGCYDLIHVAHLKILKESKALCDVLHVGINSDESIKKIKGPNRPIIPQEQRKEMLLAIKYVDHVHIFDETTPLRLIKEIDPDIVVKGGDWHVSEVVAGKRAKVVTIPLIEGVSTTKIIKKIIEDN